MKINGVLGLQRSGGLKLVRSKDDARVIDRPCLHLPQRGKCVSYALSAHSENILNSIYIYLPAHAIQPLYSTIYIQYKFVRIAKSARKVSDNNLYKIRKLCILLYSTLHTYKGQPNDDTYLFIVH
jgi:hypothetical protein